MERATCCIRIAVNGKRLRKSKAQFESDATAKSATRASRLHACWLPCWLGGSVARSLGHMTKPSSQLPCHSAFDPCRQPTIFQPSLSLPRHPSWSLRACLLSVCFSDYSRLTMIEGAQKDAVQLAEQVAEGFAALSGEYQILFDQQKQLESKLSWAKQQVCHHIFLFLSFV